MTKEIIPYPRGPFLRLLRAPLLLQQYGLGFLMRPFPFLILTTRGRKSGEPRHAVLEYRRHGSKYYVVSGWGKRPHWYKNLEADPDVTIFVGGKENAATANIVEDESEALRVLYMFQRTSRVYDILLAKLSSADSLNLNTLKAVADEFTIVRFDPQPIPPKLPGVREKNQMLGPAIILGLLAWLVWMVFTRRPKQ